MQPLRFGVAAHAGPLQEWQSQCVAALDACGTARRVARIVLDGPAPDVSSPLFRPVAQRTQPFDAAVPEVRWDAILGAERLRPLDLDFILAPSEEPPPAGLAEATRHGVWHFRFGDADAPNAPPCFWECFDGESTAGASLVTALPGSATSVLRRGCVAIDQTSLERSVDRLLGEIARWPALACTALASGSQGQAARSGPRGVERPRNRPTTLASVQLALKLGVRRAGRAFDVFFVDRWNVGIAHAPIESFLGGGRPDIDWLPELDEPDYRADPFGFASGGRRFACVERVDGATSIGMIEAIEIDGYRFTGNSIAMMTAKDHLSYPFVIEEDGQIYCIPETVGQRSVSLYRAVDPPNIWEKAATLLADFDAVDSTVFVHEGRHWLFCTDFVEPRHHRLYAFYADTLAGPYRPHALNPVKIDPRAAGCAGTPFVVDGAIYRPSQDCSRTYGGCITINKIAELTPDTFREERAAVVLPRGRYPAGVHTLSRLGDRTLVDGKRRAPTLRRVLWRLGRAMRGS